MKHKILKLAVLIAIAIIATSAFAQNATIDGYLYLENQTGGAILIFDMNGRQLKSYPLFAKGYNKIVINGNELDLGMYIYSLILNGKLVDTKKMILTE